MNVSSLLKKYIQEPVLPSPGIIENFSESENRALYLVSCFNRPEIIYLSKEFETITGYSCGYYINRGIEFWFSIIHPADVQAVANVITKAQYEMTVTEQAPATPLVLEYRIKKADGSWAWIREMKSIVSYREGKKDHILGCFINITAEKEMEHEVIQDILEKESSINHLLEVAASYKDAISTNATVEITGREKEVLSLIASGLSTKEIADRLFISINTVETHRRHLLEKFNVKNSTELIKEAYQQYLLQ